MADSNNGGAPAAAQPQSMSVLAQYVKDLSFENPGAPQTLRARSSAPNIAIGVNVQAGQVVNNEAEVALSLDVRASENDAVIFAIELVYAGVFRLTNIPQESLAPLLMIECPRLLFPFARQIVSDASRNGGFPPLMIDPIDFVGLFRQRLAEAQAQAQQGGSGKLA
jgi:preprotein translocase subunit SecB